MRSQILIAIMATAIIMSSCEWLASDNPANPSQALQGKWKLDSIAGTIDKTHSSLTNIPINFSVKELDSANLTCIFNRDTVVASFANKLHDTCSFKANKNALTISNLKDSTSTLFTIKELNDTTMSLIDKDRFYHFSKVN